MIVIDFHFIINMKIICMDRAQSNICKAREDMSEQFYNPDLDDSVIPLSYITTYILEINKTNDSNVKLEKMSLAERIQHTWSVIQTEDDLRDSLDIDKMWERPSLRKSAAEAERERKIGNSKYATNKLEEALQHYNKALSFLPHDLKNKDKNIYPQLTANRALVLHQLGYQAAALRDIQECVAMDPDFLL